jgi:hypothetical protein
MFKRDMQNVSTVADLQRVLRAFDLGDPLSKGRAIRQIAARFDLEEEHPTCGGAIDAKVSSILLGSRNRTAYLISGPPSDRAPELVWDQSKACQNVTHDGIPNHFAFPWVHPPLPYLSPPSPPNSSPSGDSCRAAHRMTEERRLFGPHCLLAVHTIIR